MALTCALLGVAHAVAVGCVGESENVAVMLGKRVSEASAEADMLCPEVIEGEEDSEASREAVLPPLKEGEAVPLAVPLPRPTPPPLPLCVALLEMDTEGEGVRPVDADTTAVTVAFDDALPHPVLLWKKLCVEAAEALLPAPRLGLPELDALSCTPEGESAGEGEGERLFAMLSVGEREGAAVAVAGRPLPLPTPLRDAEGLGLAVAAPAVPVRRAVAEALPCTKDALPQALGVGVTAPTLALSVPPALCVAACEGSAEGLTAALMLGRSDGV